MRTKRCKQDPVSVDQVVCDAPTHTLRLANMCTQLRPCDEKAAGHLTVSNVRGQKHSSENSFQTLGKKITQ